MGKSRSYEIKEYRQKIMAEICKSDKLIELFDLQGEEYPEDIIPYKYSYPHEHIPETITETRKFINFEISASIDIKNNVFKDLTILFFVLCHKGVARDIKNGGMWYDTVTCELDNILCENDILGVGKTLLVYNQPYKPNNEHIGRVLTFKVKDFNNGLKYGK